MSKVALWATRRASPKKPCNSSATAPKITLSAKNSSESPCTAKAPADIGRCGLMIAMEGATGRDVVDELERADLDDAVACGVVGPGGLRVEDDLAQNKCQRAGLPALGPAAAK